jgi:hypothetical protein
VPGSPAEPPPLVSRLRLRLVEPDTGAPVREAAMAVQVRGRVTSRIAASNGELRAQVPAGAVLVLSAPGRPTLRRTLYLDHPKPRARLERLANGSWLGEYGGRGRLGPGQVPWSAFGFAETKALLSDVDWTIRWEANERDRLWETFEAALGPRPVPVTRPGRP